MTAGLEKRTMKELADLNEGLGQWLKVIDAAQIKAI